MGIKEKLRSTRREVITSKKMDNSETYDLLFVLLIVAAVVFACMDITYQIDQTTPLEVYHTVTADHQYAGKTIENQSVSKNTQQEETVAESYVGQPQQIARDIMIRNLSTILICFLLFSCGVLFVITSLVCPKNGKTKQVLQVGTLVILFSVWSISQTSVLNFLFDNENHYLLWRTIIFLILPLYMIRNIGEWFQIQQRKGLDILKVLSAGNLILSIFFILTRIREEEKILQTTHLLIGVIIFYGLFCVRKRLKYLNHRRIQVGVIAMLCVLIDLICYYQFNLTDYSTFTRMGLLFLIGYLLVDHMREYITQSKECVQAKKIAKLAYKDVMTQLYNRTAYARDMATAEEKLQHAPDELNLIYVIFDLNNLKELNDCYGHGVGDDYIRKAGQIIKKAFENVGKCYRIGGDEFAVLIHDKKEEAYHAAIDKLQKLIEFENKEVELEFSLAFGYAVYEVGQFASLKELVDQADKDMYKNKNFYKETKLCED